MQAVEEVTQLAAEDVRQVRQTLEQEASPAVLKLDQLVAAQPGLERQGLLGKTRVRPQSPHVSAHDEPRLRPALGALRVVLRRSNGHPAMPH